MRYGTWRPLAANWAAQPRMAAHDIICLHTMAGSLAGTDSFFRQNGYGGAESHFGVGHDGTVYQWQDTLYRADANLNGNSRIVSIETADTGPGFDRWLGTNVPAWTDDQVDALAKLIAAICRAHDIPCALIPDSKGSRRGVGYHRLGIDPWRVSGGEVWSSARGKICPGDRRIAQVPAVVAAARRILNGDNDPGDWAGGTYCAYGERSDRVLNLQRFMTRVFPTYNTYVATGYYGDSTKSGIAEFQRRTGVTGPDADGSIVGPRTMTQLTAHGFKP